MTTCAFVEYPSKIRCSKRIDSKFKYCYAHGQYFKNKKLFANTKRTCKFAIDFPVNSKLCGKECVDKKFYCQEHIEFFNKKREKLEKKKEKESMCQINDKIPDLHCDKLHLENSLFCEEHEFIGDIVIGKKKVDCTELAEAI